MNSKLLITAITAAISLSACSSITNGNNQAVNFHTGEVKGADCVVSGGRDGNVYLELTTPAKVRVRRAKAAIDVECKKTGYQTANLTVQSKMEATTGGNVIAGGFVGLGIDAMTGAMFKYPDTIMLEMLKVGAATPMVTDEPIAK